MMPFSGVRISWRHHREEARLGAVGGVGLVAGIGERAFGLGAVGDVAADALHFGRLAGIVPYKPSRQAIQRAPSGVVDLLVVDARAVRLQRVSPCSSDVSVRACCRSALRAGSGQCAIGVVGKGDAAVAVAQHDQVALRFEQAVRARCRLPAVPSCDRPSLRCAWRSCAACWRSSASRMLSVASPTQAIANRKLTPIAKAWGSIAGFASGCR